MDNYIASALRYDDPNRYRRCGDSGILLPKVSLGLWKNFGHAASFADNKALMHYAFDEGITHFDLANNYGPPPGAAEEFFGEMIKTSFAHYRDELFVSTKAGYEMWPGLYGNWGSRKSLMMLLAAAVMLGIGLLWNIEFPINKMLWSSSFVLVVGAYSLAMFALFYYIVDVRGWQRWSFPLQVVGINSITIYMAQKVISFSHTNKFLFGGLASKLPPEWSDLVIRGGYVLVCWLFLYFLYRKRVFLKV